ncbi:MAG: hypothetical protein AB7F78_04150 [Hyphomicrobiaceae bacterium]
MLEPRQIRSDDKLTFTGQPRTDVLSFAASPGGSYRLRAECRSSLIKAPTAGDSSACASIYEDLTRSSTDWEWLQH